MTSRKWNQFAPRVGAIWAPAESTSVRASWGMFYDTSHLFYNIGYQGFGQGVIPGSGWRFRQPLPGLPGRQSVSPGSRSHLANQPSTSSVATRRIR